MSKILGLLAKATEFLAKNSTTILTGSTILGVGGAAITSWYAAKKTCDIRKELGEGATKTEVVKRAWPYYVAPTIFVGLTIGSVILLNAKHNERYSALLGLYAASKADKEKLGKKVKELVGDEKANQIKESLGIKTDEEKKDILTAKDYKLVNGSNVIEGDPHKQEWIIDGETGMRIYTSKIAVLSAADMTNQMIAQECDNGQTVEDFYNYLGVTDGEMPNLAQSMNFKIGERVACMKIEWGSITDKELHTYPCFNYDYNLDRVQDYQRHGYVY